MQAERLWTVVRFPNGSWSYGGRPDSPEYERCEVWRIEAATAKEAVKKAQAKRRRATRGVQPSAAECRHCDRRAASWGVVRPSDFHYEDCPQHVSGVMGIDGETDRAAMTSTTEKE
jgi:hypothetical protein